MGCHYSTTGQGYWTELLPVVGLTEMRGSTHHTYRSIYLDHDRCFLFTGFLHMAQGCLTGPGFTWTSQRAAEASTSSSNSASTQHVIIDMVGGAIFFFFQASMATAWWRKLSQQDMIWAEEVGRGQKITN